MPTDLVIGNYVYEKVHEGARTVMHYRNVFPEGREFGWDDVGHFGQSQYLLMHSVIYRTDLLRDIGLELPEHSLLRGQHLRVRASAACEDHLLP